MTASSIIAAAAAEPCHPWPRHLLATEEWGAMAAALDAEPSLELLALWADQAQVHALFRDAPANRFLPASVATVAGGYAALSPHRRAAMWFERMIRDLWGHAANGARDVRPWLDHGRWNQVSPLATRPVPLVVTPAAAEFLPVELEDHHQIPFGPVYGGIGEPAHFRFFAYGDAVLRLEARLGYAHKGTLGLMRGKSPRAAACFAARLSGTATVAHSIAFAHAAEAVTSTDAPPRAAALRAVMAELERIGNHFDAVMMIAEAAGFAPLAAPAARLREALLNASDVAFGHRLMMDCVIPGGLPADIDADGPDAIRRALATLDDAISGLIRLIDANSSLADRLAIATVTPVLAAEFAAGGPAGRAAGRAFDARKTPGYAPYDTVLFEVQTLSAGDADARLRIRLAEARESLHLVRSLLAGLPEGPVAVPLPMATGEGIGWAEAPGGDVWHWLRLEGGLIAAAFARDPAWLQLPLLEAAGSGSLVADFPLCAASFDCSVSGMDL
jgi:Ni,Fe-hydrogenase III large subunit